MKKRFGKPMASWVGAGLALLSSTQALSSPVISELYYDAVGSDAGLVFLELVGAPGSSLAGLVIEAINGTGGSVYKSVELSGAFPADGVFVIGDDDAGTTAVPDADLLADVDLQNGPDSVVLRDGTTVLDALGYGEFSAGDVFAGEGTPAPAVPAGASLARFNPFLDSGDNGADFVMLDTPTPGVVPEASPVPLPASALLFGSGILSLLVSRRSAKGI
jgi:hypothetical protein